MTPARLAELRALADAATPGPWEYDYQEIHSPSTCVVAYHAAEQSTRDEDGRFIAAARTAVPELLDRIQDLEAIRSDLWQRWTSDLDRIEQLNQRAQQLRAMFEAMKTVSINQARDRRELVQRLFQATHWDPGAESWVIPCTEASAVAMYELSNLLALDLPGDAAKAPRVEDAFPAAITDEDMTRRWDFGDGTAGTAADGTCFIRYRDPGFDAAFERNVGVTEELLDHYAPRVLSADAYDAVVQAAEAPAQPTDALRELMQEGSQP